MELLNLSSLCIRATKMNEYSRERPMQAHTEAIDAMNINNNSEEEKLLLDSPHIAKAFPTLLSPLWSLFALLLLCGQGCGFTWILVHSPVGVLSWYCPWWLPVPFFSLFVLI